MTGASLSSFFFETLYRGSSNNFIEKRARTERQQPEPHQERCSKDIWKHKPASPTRRTSQKALSYIYRWSKCFTKHLTKWRFDEIRCWRGRGSQSFSLISKRSLKTDKAHRLICSWVFSSTRVLPKSPWWKAFEDQFPHIANEVDTFTTLPITTRAEMHNTRGRHLKRGMETGNSWFYSEIYHAGKGINRSYLPYSANQKLQTQSVTQ